jgi:predicted small lipoprotein YifL
MRTLLIVALSLGVLTACGKKGPPDPPGPPAQIIWPKFYPAH